jgi:hypothetical protein
MKKPGRWNMSEILVIPKDDETFEVTVHGSTTTTHAVELTKDYYEKLTAGKVPQKTLIEKSFEFLLERESNTMILRRFDLRVIGDYFPEYEKTIVGRL